MAALLPLIVMFGLMWLLLIRPQKQQLAARRAFVDALEVGDDVVAAGGLLGRVVALDDREARVEVGPGVVVRVVRHALLAPPPAPGTAVGDDAEGDA